MSIRGIEQPEIIMIDESLRLRRFDEIYEGALKWYQDVETVRLVDGTEEPYFPDKLRGMYRFLNGRGELYYIEVLWEGNFLPIGDVSFWKDDMPIVIGDKRFRRMGIGRKVVEALVKRGKELGYEELKVGEIYDYNEGSRRCFESVGFEAYEKTEKGSRYRLKIESCRSEDNDKD